MATKDARKVGGWTEHELLVYILGAIEHSNAKIDFSNAPVPAGRNASGCVQKIGRVKNALRKEIDALEVEKKGKRKVESEDDVEGEQKQIKKAKKGGRAAKVVETEESEEEE
ncbi:hypothetical protein EKO04_005590 [Ascochyta lentis]|uniref:Uncharacterized protein n=1 Tax=Ascochyta lentis TaxID=205686 RepID=A0A8H7J418_9PLEO|nr:hypothetical protein EKO04_005590 [Ascochyta lentis]